MKTRQGEIRQEDSSFSQAWSKESDNTKPGGNSYCDLLTSQDRDDYA